MSQAPTKAAQARNETELERVDRNFQELIEELRLAIPGVQVLLAFLLILPFNSRFASVSAFERDLYVGTLLCTALASVVLIAPSFQHRLRFRDDVKEQLLMSASRLAIVGMSLLALGICGAVFLVVHFVAGDTAGAVAVAGLIAAYLVIWVVWPTVGIRS